MAYLYIDDGHFESEDYENNYVYFNDREPGSIEKMMHLAQALASLTPEKKRERLDLLRRRELRFA
ncbi:hypothetical protein JW906_04585 [bacterium]|nr:hypothetical protein [bacterium]